MWRMRRITVHIPATMSPSTAESASQPADLDETRSCLTATTRKRTAAATKVYFTQLCSGPFRVFCSAIDVAFTLRKGNENSAKEVN